MGNIADKASNCLKLRFKRLGSHIVPCGTFLRFSSPPAKNQKYYSQTPLSGHPLTRTPHYNGQFALPLVEETLTCCLILTRLILKHRQERTLPLSVRINGFDFTDTN